MLPQQAHLSPQRLNQQHQYQLQYQRQNQPESSINLQNKTIELDNPKAHTSLPISYKTHLLSYYESYKNTNNQTQKASDAAKVNDKVEEEVCKEQDKVIKECVKNWKSFGGCFYFAGRRLLEQNNLDSEMTIALVKKQIEQVPIWRVGFEAQQRAKAEEEARKKAQQHGNYQYGSKATSGNAQPMPLPFGHRPYFGMGMMTQMPSMRYANMPMNMGTGYFSYPPIAPNPAMGVANYVSNASRQQAVANYASNQSRQNVLASAAVSGYPLVNAFHSITRPGQPQFFPEAALAIAKASALRAKASAKSLSKAKTTNPKPTKLRPSSYEFSPKTNFASAKAPATAKSPARRPTRAAARQLGSLSYAISPKPSSVSATTTDYSAEESLSSEQETPASAPTSESESESTSSSAPPTPIHEIEDAREMEEARNVAYAKVIKKRKLSHGSLKGHFSPSTRKKETIPEELLKSLVIPSSPFNCGEDDEAKSGGDVAIDNAIGSIGSIVDSAKMKEIRYEGTGSSLYQPPPAILSSNSFRGKVDQSLEFLSKDIPKGTAKMNKKERDSYVRSTLDLVATKEILNIPMATYKWDYQRTGVVDFDSLDTPKFI